jgi:sulfur relay (sulfurtransferase) DsrC/TusE family protein
MTPRPEPAAPRARAAEWTTDRAEQVAREAGLAPLDPRHWKIIALYREELARTGLGPTIDRLAPLCGLSNADLRALFPGETDRLLARIAGSPPDPASSVLPFRP